MNKIKNKSVSCSFDSIFDSKSSIISARALMIEKFEKNAILIYDLQ